MTETITKPPNRKQDLLNIETIILPAVPAGVDEIEIVVESALGEGDSAGLLGAAANYVCGEPTAVDDDYFFPVATGVNGNLFSDNGFGPDDLGNPTATLTSFGGGDLGGAVTDNTAGAIVALGGGTLDGAGQRRLGAGRWCDRPPYV